MSSIAKANISLSKKDLSKSRIPLVGTRNVTFYHKATAGDLSINLLALSMPSEMPTNVQATVAEISGAQLAINKKNLSLVSSANGLLMSGLHYVVTSSTTIQLIGPYLISGAEVDEIFTGSINAAPVTDLVVASARSVDKTYTLAVGQTILNLGREYQTGQNINDDIGSIKVFVNGVLAHRGVDYEEVDAGSGYGTTISFYAAPVSLPYSIAVDFGVMSITDNNAIGTIESLSGAVIKIAADLADVAGTSITDYLTANPSEVERRTFGDMVLVHERMLDVSIPIYKKEDFNRATATVGTGNFLRFTGTIFNNTLGSEGIVDYKELATGDEFVALVDCVVFFSYGVQNTNSLNTTLSMTLHKDGVVIDRSSSQASAGVSQEGNHNRLVGKYKLLQGETLKVSVSTATAFQVATSYVSVFAEATATQTIRQLLGL